MANKEVIRLLSENQLKITPQRVAVLDIILSFDNHPSADDILQFLRLSYPHIAPGTVYKTLETLANKGIIKKVKTDDDKVRFDPETKQHHHLYCSDSQRIEDYYDDKLNTLLLNYFKTKKIKNFRIEDIKLQLVGKFTDNSKTLEK